MDIRKVKKLIEMLEESKVSEIEIHEGEESVRISRYGMVPEQNQTFVQVPAGEPRAAINSAVPSATTVVQEEVKEPEGNFIKSPMVGIFYGSPAPDKPAFVEYGSQVNTGDVVCIIEAMKIMNQIESELTGVVSRVLVENGEPVEYGQPLFQVREA